MGEPNEEPDGPRADPRRWRRTMKVKTNVKAGATSYSSAIKPGKPKQE